MEKKEFIKFLNDIFKLNGFSKKGSTWYSENENLIKKIVLQKSRYGNIYYLNYGFILKKLELYRLNMHVSDQLSSVNDTENKRIIELLNFENNITNEQREKELRLFIDNNMLCKLNNINSETDIIADLKKRPHLNDIPLTVKKYFNLN